MKKEPFASSSFRFYLVLFFWYFIYLASVSQGRADKVLVAVAANFYNPFKEIAGQFEKKTGHQVEIISGSTGKLYAQITNGAPFEVFLAADARRPFLLEEEGKAVSGTRFTYALGKITLWSPNPNAILEDGKLILRQKKFTHISMANPITAPYGRAALQTLKNIELWEEVQPYVVQGENISQTFQFVFSQKKLGR